MKLKKILLWLLALGFLAIVAVVLFIWFSLNGIVKTGVETVGPKFTGAPVTLASASISPFSGGGSLSGLEVSNPEGFSQPHAMRLGGIDVSVDLKSVSTDTIIVNYIRIVEPEITYERRLTSDNLAALQANIQKAVGAPEEKPKEEAGPAKKVIIRELSVTGGKIRVAIGSLPAIPVPMPDIKLKDIGEDKKGASPAEALGQIFGAVTKGVGSAVGSAGPEVQKNLSGAADKAVEGVKGVGEKVKGLFGK